MVLVDHLLKGIKHASTIYAPAMIVVNFFQIMGLLIDLDVAWPPALLKWMSFFNMFNINLEQGRPECSGKFGAEEKLKFVLLLPWAMLALLLGYALIQIIFATRVSAEEFRVYRTCTRNPPH